MTKSFDEALRAAFFQGVRFGVRYPEEEAIPAKEADIQFRAWRDDLVGETWTPERWLRARIDAGLVLSDRVIHPPPPSFGASMGHPGGHYG